MILSLLFAVRSWRFPQLSRATSCYISSTQKLRRPSRSYCSSQIAGGQLWRYFTYKIVERYQGLLPYVFNLNQIIVLYGTNCRLQIWCNPNFSPNLKLQTWEFHLTTGFCGLYVVDLANTCALTGLPTSSVQVTVINSSSRAKEGGGRPQKRNLLFQLTLWSLEILHCLKDNCRICDEVI